MTFITKLSSGVELNEQELCNKVIVASFSSHCETDYKEYFAVLLKFNRDCVAPGLEMVYLINLFLEFQW